MSISTVYADPELTVQSASALAVVPSGQAAPANAEQLLMLNERLRSEVSLFKGLAIGGAVLAAGIATVAVVQRALMNQKLNLARAEGAAVGYTPRGAAPPPPQYPAQPYGYPPAYYR